jgi:hypothetical protein
MASPVAQFSVGVRLSHFNRNYPIYSLIQQLSKILDFVVFGRLIMPIRFHLHPCRDRRLRPLCSGIGQNPRWWFMMTPLLILWAGLTVVLIVLLIYRSTLSMHEDDQLFLGNSEAHMAKEQQELIVKMNKIEPWVKVCGAGSALLFFLIAGIMLYSRFNI